MLPYFFIETIEPDADRMLLLSEAASRHCIQVLRMQAMEEMCLTDGRGLKALARIVTPDRKHCRVQILKSEQAQPAACRFSLGIAFTKNNSRNEWLLEKATELGIAHIYPLLTRRSEREKLKQDRLQGILVAAMLQSQQCFLPVLHAAMLLGNFLQETRSDSEQQRFIAHCNKREKRSFVHSLQPGKPAMILIGPEGDFTEEEVTLCRNERFLPVSLGPNRLRTETAGIYACVLFNALNDD